MYAKAICDMIPSEFLLDCIVLYLVIQFAKDSLVGESNGPYKNGAVNSIA